MARKYEVAPGRYAWNPDRCEEILIITAYNEIAKFIAPAQQWGKELEYVLYDRGTGIGFRLIEQINEVRRRKKLTPLVLRETDIPDYARDHDKLVRAARHRNMRDGLAILSDTAVWCCSRLSRRSAISSSIG
jgi:hypothetical protein